MATKKPAKRRASKTRTSKKRTAAATKYVPPSARRVRGGLQCPDCDFVARHAMGLGRHRSARHGVASKRSARPGGGRGGWISREQAAERAGVHYNTIRQWERAGLVKTAKRPGLRGIALSQDDLERFLVERGGYQATPTSDASAAAIAALQGRYDRLISDLEKLLEVARNARPTTSKPRAKSKPRGKSKGTRARSKPRAAAKARAGRRRARRR